MKTLIIADSRGAGLQPLLEELGQIDTHTLVHRGAGYLMAARKSLGWVNTHNPSLVILMTGVCDLTQRSPTTKITSLRHNTVQGNVEQVIGSAQAALGLLRAAWTGRITLATITGIDLSDYNNPSRKHMSTDEYKKHCLTDKATHPQQDILNLSVLEINRQITGINRINRVPTIWTGGVVHTYSKRKTYHYYIRLSDGCHADNSTKLEWANQIYKTTNRILAQPVKKLV